MHPVLAADMGDDLACAALRLERLSRDLPGLARHPVVQRDEHAPCAAEIEAVVRVLDSLAARLRRHLPLEALASAEVPCCGASDDCGDGTF